MQKVVFDASFAPLFYISSMLLILILQVHDIVEQREKGTISLLMLAGLWYDSHFPICAKFMHESQI